MNRSRLVIIALAGLVVVAWLSLAINARGHGAAEWIQRGDFKNALGELCCGERDCAQLADEDIQVTPDGYLIKSIGETVPFAEATPTPPEIGGFWRCYWAGKRRCFFAPPPAT